MAPKRKSLASKIQEAAHPSSTPQINSQSVKPELKVEAQTAPQKTKKPPSRQGLKTVCVHVDPEVQKVLRYLALDEDSTVQALMIEALNMLLSSRGKPPIA